MAIETKSFTAKLSELIPNERNPRQISPKAFSALKKSLLEFPEMQSIREIIVDEDMKVLGGHQRLKALKELGETRVPVKQVIGLTDEQKDEFVIKDNIQQGDWDPDVLMAEWNSDSLVDWGIDAKWLSRFTEYLDDIDDEGNGAPNRMESVLRFSNKEVPMTTDEEIGLKDLLDRYVGENQVAYGFVDYILKHCKD